MFYAIVIVFGALLIFVWRFTKKPRALTKLQDVNQSNYANERKIKGNAADVKHNINNNLEIRDTGIKESVNKNYDTNTACTTHETQIDSPIKLKENIEANLRFRKCIKRDSPPKERLAEFLEKTVLNEDKLQSIIENLSLTKYDIPSVNNASEIIKSEEFEKPIEVLNSMRKEGVKAAEIVVKDEAKEEPKPLLLRRLEKQSGIPAGINFGSLIGELKNKTRNPSNGALKPVFRKFDVDTVDTVQDVSTLYDSANFLIFQIIFLI